MKIYTILKLIKQQNIIYFAKNAGEMAGLSTKKSMVSLILVIAHPLFELMLPVAFFFFNDKWSET